MDPRARPQIEAWLRYFDNLGLGPFYLDRAAVELPATGGEGGHMGPPLRGGLGDEKGGQMGPSHRSRVAPASPPLPVTVSSAARAARAQDVVLPVLPSLFNAAPRVEGDTLPRIREDIGDCKRCRLCEARNKIVFGDGNAKAELVFIGEGPGHDEDVQGLPFVGRAGKLLTQMIEAMGLRREEVYICNIVKCRPPGNRQPERDEVATCSPFLDRQLAVIRPKVVVCLGNVAAQTLLGTNKSISQFRGQWFDFRGSKMLATYHPAFLLRTPSAKSEVWKDLKKVMAELGLKAPKPRPKSG